MNLFCSHCGQAISVEDESGARAVVCPVCGGSTPLPQPGDAAVGITVSSDSGSRSSRRYREDLLVAFAVVAVFALLFLLLFQPEGSGAVQQVRKAVFGQRILEAAARAQNAGGGRRSDQGGSQGQQQGGAQNGSQAGAQNGADGNATGQANGMASANGRSTGGGGPSGGRAGRREAGDDSPVNPQHPASQPFGPSRDDMPEHSLGRLSNVPGAATPDRPTRAGAAGTNEPNPLIGNTNIATARPDTFLLADNPNALTNNNAISNPPPSSASTNARPFVRDPSRPSTNASFIGDEFSTRLARAGARSGDVQVSLMWNNVNDLDLHVVDPSGEEIYYQHLSARSGGILDIDNNARNRTDRPVENIYWPVRAAPPGNYKVFVNHYQNRGGRDPTQFTVRVYVKGSLQTITGAIRHGEPKKAVWQFTIPAR